MSRSPRRRQPPRSLEVLETRRVPATVRVSNLSVTERDPGQSFRDSILVELSEPATRPVRIYYQTEADTASGNGPGRDFVGTRGVLTLRRGQFEGRIRIPILGDNRSEPTEGFNVVLARADNATLQPGPDGRQVARVTIFDDDADPIPRLTVAGFRVVEGETTGNFTLRLSEAATSTVTIQYRIFGSFAGARAGADFLPAAGTVIFAPGERTKVVPVTILDDDVAESDEDVLLNITGATNVTFNGYTTILTPATILANDETGTPDLAFYGYEAAFGPESVVVEGDGGVRTARFNVVLSRKRTSEVTVRYATADGTATAGSDYLPASGTIRFAPGETTKSVEVTVLGDPDDEPYESFFLNLIDPVDATILTPLSVGTIVNDDGLTTPPTPAVAR